MVINVIVNGEPQELTVDRVDSNDVIWIRVGHQTLSLTNILTKSPDNFVSDEEIERVMKMPRDSI
jgi:hypothetical protein